MFYIFAMKFQDEPTVFRELFGDTPKIRVLEFLLEGRELDCSLGDIAEGAGIDRVTLFRLWPALEKLNAVTHTRDIGNALKCIRGVKTTAEIKKLKKIHLHMTISFKKKLYAALFSSLIFDPSSSQYNMKENQKGNDSRILSMLN